MAFYGDFGKRKSKEQKRQGAEMRGGFEDEGSQYSGAARSGKPTRSGKARPSQGGGGYEGNPKSNAPLGKTRPSQGGGGYEGNPRGNAPLGKARSSQGGGGYEGNPKSNAPLGKAPYGKAPVGRGKPGYQGAGPAREDGQKGFEGRAKGNAAPERGAFGTRPARPEFGGKRGAPRKEAQEYRFARDAGQRYSERGSGTKPRPYGEQRETGRQGSVPPRFQQFAPRTPAGRVEPHGANAYHHTAPVAYDTIHNAEVADVVPAENLLSGRNPIREALKSGRDIEKLLVARGELSGSAREIVQMAREKRIPVQEVDRVRLDAITHNHQGMLAFASAHEYHTVQDMLDLAAQRGEAPLLVILDGITDPHNLGAIIRTAECAGAHGVIVQERRAVGLTPAAVKASAGAVEYLPVARVTNLTTTLLELKAQNVWAYAADMKGEDFAQVDFSGGVALVIGAEGEGVSRRVLDTCDRQVSLPIRGQIDSLNASVAAGVLLYAAMRKR